MRPRLHTTKDPPEEGWRVKLKSERSDWPENDDRHALLCEQFDHYTESSYCFYWTDPLYRYGW